MVENSIRKPFILERILKITHLFNPSDLEPTRGNGRRHFLPSILLQTQLIMINASMIHLRQKMDHLRMNHGCEQVRMQSRVSKSFLELPTTFVSLICVNLARRNFLLVRNVETEGESELTV